MDDIKLENYKKSVARLIEDWAKEAAQVGKELAPIEDELEKLEANKSPSPDDKKRIEELKKKCAALHKRMDNASASLSVNLVVIDVPPKADEDELAKFPGWVKQIIKAKGIPLGKGVSIAPDVDFDFKAKKLKRIGITIKW
jgi:hypothetical protein